MNSRVTFKEILSMFFVIISFMATGIMIMNGKEEYALISLCAAAFCVLLAFIAMVSGENDKILDLSNPSLRNPRKSNSKKKVRYIDRLTTDIAEDRESTGYKKRKNQENLYNMDMGDGGDFYESVGNMRVYKRGEEIEVHSDDEDNGGEMF